MRPTTTNLAAALARANWEALQHPEMEYRVLIRDGKLEINQYPAHSNNYHEFERVLYTACYWPGFDGNRPKEQAAFKAEIPEIIKGISDPAIISAPDPVRPPSSKLQARRRERGLTQSQLAAKAGVKLHTLQRYEANKETGLRCAASATVSAIAKVLRCKPEQIID